MQVFLTGEGGRSDGDGGHREYLTLGTQRNWTQPFGGAESTVLRK